jgi:hypothetical protein
MQPLETPSKPLKAELDFSDSRSLLLFVYLVCRSPSTFSLVLPFLLSLICVIAVS